METVEECEFLIASNSMQLKYGLVTNANVQEMFKVSRVTALRLLNGLSSLVELLAVNILIFIIL